jgi:PKD repeat protein
MHGQELAEKEVENNNQLVILPLDNNFKLAYKCDVYTINPMKRAWLYIDANSGAVLKDVNAIETIDVPGTAETQYSGKKAIVADSFATSNFRLREYTRGAGVETYDYLTGSDYFDSDNSWVTSDIMVRVAYDAHYGAEATYDFYYNGFGWSSVDGNGQTILKSYLNNNGAGNINAFWDQTAHTMNYGQGDVSGGVTPLTSLEICGHELTHGVTQYSSNLTYSGESGGLNESFSDIAGATIRFIDDPDVGSWYLGDQINYIFRNMADPKQYSCPDTYGGQYWSSFGDPHILSGVQNYWYYLLVEGGSGINDNSDSYSILGIGLNDASVIAMRNDMFYLTASSDYAEARDMAIQSAIDLFGDCTPQVIQTTNAWHAVGVGDLYQNAVTAIFSVGQTNYCSVPTTIQFTNNSINGTSYVWDFGDGTTSTDSSPAHTYTQPGVYTVSLITNGIAICNNSDTLTYIDYLTIDDIGQPVAASCIPTTTSPGSSYGIFNVKLNTINHSSGGSDEGGYLDLTCSDFTELVAGDPYSLSITTSSSHNEDLSVWIDFNNNGSFDNTELVFHDDAVQGVHTTLFSVPATAVQNTPLRLRCIDDKSNNDITDACYNSEKGQAEDYSVVILPVPDVAPVADFVADATSINFGQLVNYTDLSVNSPTSWEWHFEGGNPATSSDKNPTNIQYDEVGAYDVTLIATNAFGTDTIVKPDYITVNAVFNLCEVDTTDLSSGTFYDSGGPLSSYGDNENCTLLISPPCVASLTLNFNSFNSEFGQDIMNVYDGPDATAPLILTVSGNPFPLPSVTGYSGQLFITWVTDNNGTNSGFSIDYTSVVGGTITPVAEFNISDVNPPVNISVEFTDQSLNLPFHWSWDFGDGTTSILQNPSHSYLSSGTFSVKLIASNCGGADTITKTLTVQEPPVMVVDPQSLEVDLNCIVDSVVIPFTISNTGGGDLIYNETETEYSLQGSQPKILALTYGIDNVDAYPNTITAISTYFSNFTLSTINTTNSDSFTMALQGNNVCLITKPTGLAANYTNYATPLLNFVNNGGTVIICGTSSSNVDCIFNTGLLSGSYGSNGNNQPLTVVNTTHPLTQSLGSIIHKGPKNTYALNFTNDMEELIDYQGYTALGYRDMGLGHVIYAGFDFKNNNDTSSIVMGNAMTWIDSMLVDDWITISPVGGGTIAAGDQQVFNVTVKKDGLPDGTYTEYFIITGNDINNPVDTVTCKVNINTADCVAFIATNACDGQVCFDDSIQTGATSVSWSFGDGSTSTQNDPCHTYSSSGTYDVQLIACGASGCDTVTQSITVTILAASIDYSPTVAFENEIISFSSNSSGAVSWSWDFGDGNTSTLQNPAHAYSTAGVYTVILTVTDASGCTLTTQANDYHLNSRHRGNFKCF